ncbi:unnamed protein product [Caenorhabditis brenneri]
MSTLSQFPLFKLPWLAIKGVLSNMEFGTLLYLSFSSKHIYRFIQSLRINVAVFKISYSKIGTLVQFSFAKWYGIGEWSFRETEIPAERKNQALTIFVGGLELKSLVKFNRFITYTNGELGKSVEPGIKYLTQLFICPLPRIYIRLDGMKKPILPSIVGCGDYCEDILIRGEEEIENEELHMILDNYTFKEDITFAIPFKEDFTSDIRLWKHPKKIYIHRSAHWVTSEMLFGVKCSYMAFGGCKQLKAIDCRLFVDRWMNSNDLNFHFLELFWKSDYPEELNYDYFGGLELEEFDPKSRSFAYCQCEGWAINVSMGRDFKRKDGLLATITLIDNCFIFCVWHERFPNLEGRKVFNNV